MSLNTTTKKIGILGGAFNPIHIGHIEIANAVINNTDCDEIWFLVSFNPPHKNLKDVGEYKHRYNMVKLATDINKHFIVSDIEYQLYKDNIYDVNSSYNVMSYITNKYPDNVFNIIIGYDELLDIESWKNYQKLLNEYSFIIIKRTHYNVDQSFINELKEKFDFKYTLLDVKTSPCSSTDIRNELKETNKSIYLDNKVLDYIINNNLYN